MDKQLSKGQELFHVKKIYQASCFPVSCISMDKRLEWSDSFSKKQLRNDPKRFKENSLFLVLSQNCDIACNIDSNDSTIEIAVCKNIKQKEVFAGNTFVKSVRKFQFVANDVWYEANVDYILHVDKHDLLETISNSATFELTILADEFAKSVPFWRANRYLRSAFPDKFNIKLHPVLDKHLEFIESAATPREKLDFSSYIRAIYVWINSFEELDFYEYDIFALLRDDTPNEILSEIQDKIENMANELSEISGYDDKSEVYAGKENTTFVSYLTKFVRLNLDNHSLSKGDEDTGPELINTL